MELSSWRAAIASTFKRCVQAKLFYLAFGIAVYDRATVTFYQFSSVTLCFMLPVHSPVYCVISFAQCILLYFAISATVLPCLVGVAVEIKFI